MNNAFGGLTRGKNATSVLAAILQAFGVVKIIAVFFFFLVAYGTLPTANAAFVTPPRCADLFETDAPVIDAFFDEFIGAEKIPLGRRFSETQNNFVNYLTEISETSPHFSSFGKSISRLFLRAEIQYAPLNVLLQTHLSPRQKTELIKKLFRSGYRLSRGSGKYNDTGDIDKLMTIASVEPLAIAVESSEDNREILRQYFSLRSAADSFWNRTLTTTPLHTEIGGEAYATVVIEKLKLLHQARVDLTGVLEGVTSPAWMNATSAQRVAIASALPYELSTPDAITHLFRETETTSAGVTALMYAVSTRDQPLVDTYRKYGANADVIVPEQTDKTTAEHMHWIAGETIRQLAKRLKVKLPY